MSNVWRPEQIPRSETCGALEGGGGAVLPAEISKKDHEQRSLSLQYVSDRCFYSSLRVRLQPRQRPITPHNSQASLRDILHAITSSQLHTSLELIIQSLQHQIHSLLTIIRQTPKRRSSHPAALRSESQGFEHVSSASNAAIDMNSNATGCCFNAFGESVD